MPKTYANPEVLAFYRDLPFNYFGEADKQADYVRRTNSIRGYPFLSGLLRPGTTVLDAGCGAGWFSLAAAYHFKARATGIDFNPVAIERARAVAAALGAEIEFQQSDLFLYEPPAPFDLVASIGVLHHTDDCMAGVRRVFDHFVRSGGHALIGLYHRYGRKPFLDHFRRMMADGASEAAMFDEYRRLEPPGDRTHLLSWFRDQVLHPHETQHTLAEVLETLAGTDARLVCTSINSFAPVDDVERLLATEPSLEQVGVERLRQGRYFPGFFVVLLRKGDAC